MAITNLQASRALKVVPSDTINIPNPAAEVATGTTTGVGTTANDVKDSAATFTTTVNVGDIVVNNTDGAIHVVSAVVDDNNLTLASGSIGNSKSYTIYAKDSKAMPSLYVGVTGNVVVEMAGGDVVTLVGVPAGATLPINVVRVNSTNTTATDIVALF